MSWYSPQNTSGNDFIFLHVLLYIGEKLDLVKKLSGIQMYTCPPLVILESSGFCNRTLHFLKNSTPFLCNNLKSDSCSKICTSVTSWYYFRQ